MSTIAAGTTSGTALVSTGDTTGALVLQTNGTTTAVTIGTNQVVTLAQPLPVASGGTGGAATPTAGGIVYGTGTAQAVTAAGTSGQVLQSNGASAPTWTTVASGLSAATQAQMEAASSNTVAATPLNTNWHPGVAKAWINGTTTGAINSSWNIASISDNGVGECTVFIATDFSSVNYVVAVGITAGSTRSVITPNLNVAYFTGLCTNFSNTLSDPDAWLFVCYGDQA
jgi:hypothetical protein